jgi:hypothetical protein
MLEIRLLGAGRIFDDRGEIKIASRRWTLPLLAYILLQRGKPILRQRRVEFIGAVPHRLCRLRGTARRPRAFGGGGRALHR